jgi:hypothetical protein
MLLSGFGGVFTADFRAAIKRRRASRSLYCSLDFVVMAEFQIQDEPIHLTPNILITFAMIIQAFARLEWLIQMSISAVGELNLARVLILTRNVGYQGKRDVLFALMEDVCLDVQQKEEIRGFLDAADKYSTVRNHIAHSLWAIGTRPQSFKPMSVAIRYGKLKFHGILEDETDYIESDFIKIADKLTIINNSYVDFLRRSGLTASIERKIEEIISRNSASRDNG